MTPKTMMAMLQTGRHRLETEEGAVRTGRVTKINTRVKMINGEPYEEPISVVINNDESDFLDWDRIKTIDRIP